MLSGPIERDQHGDPPSRPGEKAAVNALAYEGRVQELLYRRGQEAEKYWRENFAEVMGKELKTSASTTSN